MRLDSSRNGSALLVVLGMMVFIVTSAVAFAAYMRTQRLPSSFVRRGSASRQAVKAALARAIDEIDRSVGDNLMPGLGTDAANWRGRVFMPAGNTGAVNREGDTAPVLTLEALAYLPPSHVNEARYWSRHSNTARWALLDFGAGQYAYTALDVSDFLDVNRLVAEYPRSSAPNRRIGASYLFENYKKDGGPHRDVGQGTAWGEFMKNYRDLDPETGALDYSSKTPLLSLADFNLALYAHENGEDGVAGLKSLFGHFVDGGGKGGFYGVDPTATDAKSMSVIDMSRRMTFVTDSWFPPSWRERQLTGNGLPYDLNNSKYQPYKASELRHSMKEKAAIAWCAAGYEGGAGLKRLQMNLPRLAMGALYDYIDEDMVPYSLSLPTTERVAMISAIRLKKAAGAMKLKFSKSVNGGTDGKDGPDESGAVAEDGSVEKTRTVAFKIDRNELSALVRLLEFEVLTVYPFTHNDGLEEKYRKFTVDGCLSFFLASQDAAGKWLPLRCEDGDEMLSMSSMIDDDGKMTESKFSSNAIYSFPVVGEGSSYKVFDGEAGGDDPEMNSLYRFSFRGRGVDSDKVPTDTTVMEFKYKWTEQKNKPRQPTHADLAEMRSAFRPVSSKGQVDEDFPENGDKEAVGKVQKGGMKREVRLCASVTFKVTNCDGDIVDLVPACMTDDNAYQQPAPTRSVVRQFVRWGGGEFPIMRLDLTEAGMTVDADAVSGSQSQELELNTGKTLVVADPRFNHAPENWFSVGDTDGKDIREVWLENNHASDPGRDGDIFMAVSDQGYLQSIYELAFIPRFTDDELIDYRSGTEGTDFIGETSYAGDYTLFGDAPVPDQFPESFGETKDCKFMWHSYRPYPTVKGGPRDDFLRFGFTSGSKGFKVNPFTDNTNVLMAAFANTPHSWRVASTNNIDIGADIKIDEFNQKYAFNEYSQGSKIVWKDLVTMAGAFMGNMRSGAVGADVDWEEKYSNLPWQIGDVPEGADGDQSFMGVALSDKTSLLTSADQRFFYGFWHDCFAVRQQLFLIVVRCDPTLMGSGSDKYPVPQLGARAVALVWRDPEAPRDRSGKALSASKGYVPHRTRLLFYRQLD